jgi:hypothetical protein
MSDTLYVTPAQVLAAKLALELNQEAGEPPDEALEAIANAEVIAPQESGSSQRTSVDEKAPSESLATLNRIEHHLQVLDPDRDIQDRTPATVDPDVLEKPPWASEEDVNPPSITWLESEGRELQVGASADEPEVGQRGGSPEEQKEVEETLREEEWRKRERQRGQRDRKGEEPDRDTDEPWSGGFDR